MDPFRGSVQPEREANLRTVPYMDTKQVAVDVITRMKAVLGVESDIELSTHFGGSKTLMSNRKMRGSVPYEEAMELAVAHGLSLDWLLLGRGDAPEGVPEVPPMAAREAEAEYSRGEFVEVPLYDLQAAAGEGRLFSSEQVKSILHFRRDWLAGEGLFEKDLVALEVVGDSMAGTLQERDITLVNRSARAGDGVYLLRMGEALRIKRLQWRADGSLRLSSDNELYDPETVYPENMDQIEILGHCHWRGGRIY